MRIYIAFALLLIISASCIPLKKQVYFQGEISQSDSIQKLQNEPYRLQVNDMLDIQIKSSDQKLVELFDQNPTNAGNMGGNARFSEEGLYFTTYSIDRHGNIRLPYLGDINVLGYTTTEVTEKIESKFQVYFKNPEDVFVTVRLAGIRVTVIGEVEKTGTHLLYLNEANLVQALAVAGDIKITGNRENVSVYRKEIDGTKKYVVNMLDINSFDENTFFVQPNDIIYVEPLKQKSWGTGTSGMQTITSLIAVLSLVTTTILLINQF
jgi:polysaccharide export outer membrane protein